MENIGTKTNIKTYDPVGRGAPQALPLVVLTPTIQIQHHNKTKYTYGKRQGTKTPTYVNDEYSQSSIFSTRPCFTGLHFMYSIFSNRSFSFRMVCS